MNRKIKGSRKIVAIVLVVLISTLMCQFSAVADSGDSPLFMLYHGGEHGIFDETVEAGGTGSITFAFQNGAETEDRTNAILVYDALTNTNGGNKIMTPENYTRDLVASWFEFETEVLTLAPNESVNRELTFKVPEGTPPGNYCAILAMYNAEAKDPVEKTDEEKNIGITINQAITQTTAIVIRVPGVYEREMHLLENFEHDYGTIRGNLLLSVPFSNDSTAYDFPTFDLKIYDSENNLRHETSRRLPIVYAQTTSNYVTDVSSANLEAGIYTVNVVMTYGNNEFDGRDEMTYILDLSEEDVQEAQVLAEEHMLRTADDLLIGGGSLLLIIILIILLMRRPKGKRGKSRKNKRGKKQEEVNEVKTRKRGNRSEL